MFGLAWMVGPVLGTIVYALDPDALWLACGVLGGVAAVLALRAGRMPAPSTAGQGAAAIRTPT